MILAGLVCVADWVGSNTDFFPYTHPSALAEYVRCAETNARKALDRLGWLLRPSPLGVRGFADLFPGLEPNNLQRAVETLATELEEPGMVVIEAPMGEGKTEAAMYLADHWATSTGQEGHYFALPDPGHQQPDVWQGPEFSQGSVRGRSCPTTTPPRPRFSVLGVPVVAR